MPASQSYTSDGSKTTTSDPFTLNGNKYNTKVETTLENGNIKSSAITLQKQVTTRSGANYQEYATSYDGGKTWYEPGVKPLKKVSTSTGLTADEVKGLQPGGDLNKGITNASQTAIKKSEANTNQLNQLKNGNDAKTNPNDAAAQAAATQKEITEELSKSRKRTSYDPLVFYPENLQLEYQDCIKFSMIEYVASGLSPTNSQSNRSVTVKNGIPTIGTRKILSTIVLPIPGGISDSNGVDWQGDALDALGEAVANLAMQGITKGGEGVQEAGKEAGAAAKKEIQGLQKTYASKFTEAATGTSRIMQRQYGAAVNPNLELLFNSPQLRSFSFTFRLSPRSESEAVKVKKIIRYFKQGMTPKRSDGYLLLQSPNTFAISYITSNKEHPYLNKFKECALTQCNVDYTPEGNYMSYDGEERSMTSYQLTLQFQELVPLFDDDYTTADGDQDKIIGF